MTIGKITSVEWIAWGVTNTEGKHAVYLSDDVSEVRLTEDVEDYEVTTGAGRVVRSHSRLRGIDMEARLRGFTTAFSDLSMATAASNVGLTALLEAMTDSVEAMRPQLETLYYACVDHIETPEQAEAFEALTDWLGV